MERFSKLAEFVEVERFYVGGHFEPLSGQINSKLGALRIAGCDDLCVRRDVQPGLQDDLVGIKI